MKHRATILALKNLRERCSTAQEWRKAVAELRPTENELFAYYNWRKSWRNREWARRFPRLPEVVR